MRGSSLIASFAVVLAACDQGADSPPAPQLGWLRGEPLPRVLPQDAAPPATTRDTYLTGPSLVRDDEAQVWRLFYATRRADAAIADLPSLPLIRCAESQDLQTWVVLGDDALATAVGTAWDGSHVEAPTVVRNPVATAPASERWLMFYAGGNRNLDTQVGRPLNGGEPYFAIGLAISADGRRFTRAATSAEHPGRLLTVAQVLGPSHPDIDDGWVSDPEAIVHEGVVRLYCTSVGEETGGGQRTRVVSGISRVDATDGRTFSAPAANPLASLFRPGESAGGAQPAIKFDALTGRFTLLFCNDSAAEAAQVPAAFFGARGYWSATSRDGLDWTPDYRTHDFAWQPANANERYGLQRGCSVATVTPRLDVLVYPAWSAVGAPDPNRYVVPLRDGTAPAGIAGLNIAIRHNVYFL